MSARHKQISERAGHEQAMRVLFETAVAHLGEAKHSLNDADRMLDFGAHLQFGPVFRPLDLVHDTAVAIAAVDEVLCSRCVLTDHHPLARDTPGRPTREFRCRVADRAAPCCRRHWPASPPPRGSACCGCRPRNAPSSRSIMRNFSHSIQSLRVRFGKPNTQVCHQMFSSTGTMSSCFRSPSSPYALDQRLPYTSAPPASWHVR